MGGEGAGVNQKKWIKWRIDNQTQRVNSNDSVFIQKKFTDGWDFLNWWKTLQRTADFLLSSFKES